MTTVAVLCPSKNRPDQLLSRAADLLEQETPEGVSLLLVLAIIRNDWRSLGMASHLEDEFSNVTTVWRSIDSTAVDGWMMAYRQAYADGADWFVLGADDVIYHPGWLGEALKVAGDTGAQVIGLNDGHTDLDDYAPHYMASRDFCEKHLDNRMIPEEYCCWWFDRHVCQLAQLHGLYAPAWDSWAEHRHPDWRTASMDDTYREALEGRELDRAIYMAWLEESGYALQSG